MTKLWYLNIFLNEGCYCYYERKVNSGRNVNLINPLTALRRGEEEGGGGNRTMKSEQE